METVQAVPARSVPDTVLYCTHEKPLPASPTNANANTSERLLERARAPPAAPQEQIWFVSQYTLDGDVPADQALQGTGVPGTSGISTCSVAETTQFVPFTM